MTKPSCKVCKYFAKKRQEIPNCDECLPDIYYENEDAARVFLICYDQILVAPNGRIIGLDLNAIIKTIEMLHVINAEECLAKVRYLFDELILTKNRLSHGS